MLYMAFHLGPTPYQGEGVSELLAPAWLRMSKVRITDESSEITRPGFGVFTLTMTSQQPLVLCWGIISTGGIATQFSKDLLIDPKTRDVHDIKHRIAAIGSRSVEKAQDFINTSLGGDKSIKAYGNYEDVYKDADVDVIYVATPHTYHYENALDAIKAKKHVLCEKPVTSNTAELRSLLAAAKEHDVFFMEAMWTRFQPLSLEFKKISDGGDLGLPVSIHADLSGNFHIESEDLGPKTRGRGSFGPWPLPIGAIMALYENPGNSQTKPHITGSILKTPITGVDRDTSFTLTFNESKLAAQAVLSCSINTDALEFGVIVRYEKGSIKVASPIYVPKSYVVQYFGEKGQIVKEETRFFEYVGRGMHYQADEVARCIQTGKKESALWGHEKSLLEMQIFDEVRKQGGYQLPPGVEKVV
ncbi:hypothetical protein D9757_006396 [Collybiopsis confluens]|uniref:D-xylose 1-dehydrogenase (NADP(+), D-xylono-1,5-lactone-forming) n=1 Tax=Collybiopsis confluens TaxID=2823264 RepID=A0A8H5HG41_9AGAR|nr:hypothetical protein D9757_006396 [Collybiopsis confluens]